MLKVTGQKVIRSNVTGLFVVIVLEPDQVSILCGGCVCVCVNATHQWYMGAFYTLTVMYSSVAMVTQTSTH